MSELLKPARFNEILRLARDHKLPGSWSGSSYRYHPCGVIREGMLFINKWNTHGYCEIFICDNIETEWTDSGDYPRSSGDPVPKPVNGKLLEVFDTGTWKHEGPWVEKAIRILASLENEILLAQKASEAKRLAFQEEAKNAEKIKLDKFVNAHKE